MADSNLHFLVVDDDADSRSTIVEYLRSSGFNQVTLAHNGTEALRLLDRDTSINFIISDWEMPLMNGLSLLQRVKSNPERAQAPFLVITSPVSTEAEKVSLAAENRVNGYLIKPFRVAVFQEKIKNMLTVAAFGNKRRIVVADDDSDAREMLLEYLTFIGFKDVVLFADGKSALAYIQESWQQVGLIISDWEMSQLSGIDLLRTCRMAANLELIPFLMVTSQSSIERIKVVQAMSAKVDQYLLKPFNLSNFRSRILQLMDRVREQREIRGWVNQGWSDLKTGNFRIAQTRFEQVLKLDPDNFSGLMGLASTVGHLEGAQASIVYYKRAVEVDSGQVEPYLLLSDIYDNLNMPERAIALLVSGSSHVESNSELHFRLGKLYNKSHLLDRAIVELEKALNIRPDHQEGQAMMNVLQNRKKGVVS